MVLKLCTGYSDREPERNTMNMRPESLEEATVYILQYQFSHRIEKERINSPEVAFRSVCSRCYYSEERSPPHREYRERDVTSVRSRAEGSQNPGESSGRDVDGQDGVEGAEQGGRQERKKIDVSDASVARGDNRCSPGDYLKDSYPNKALNPNGLDSLSEQQKVDNLNGLDPPDKPQKLVNPNSSVPPYQPQRKIPNVLASADRLRRTKDRPSQPKRSCRTSRQKKPLR
ncbi:hypothetical protein PoB_001158700 [Plakobranchus ocellatus]|uniref:Uncharacterized protein n=1 Tax=Plakobranchus ocellatus TaxID=259542 RepID=A0AAV3YQ27_9GAST|nr:hypothetical protein PoB_001158700 [Plakobranchus ocellatus]